MQKIQAALTAAFSTFGLTARAVAIVAVEEIEAWLLLFLDILHGFRKDWVVPGSFRGIDTSLHADPKGLLRQISRKSRNATHAENATHQRWPRAAKGSLGRTRLGRSS